MPTFDICEECGKELSEYYAAESGIIKKPTEWCKHCEREEIEKSFAKTRSEIESKKDSDKPKTPKKTESPKKKEKKKIGIDDSEPILSNQATLFGGRVPFRGKRGMHVRDYKKYMDQSSLDAATERLESVKSKYGFVPMSIIPVWYNDKDPELSQVVNDEFAKGSYGDNRGENEWVDDTAYRGQFQGLSQFPPRVSKFIVQKWGVPDGEFYDPFGGRMSIPLIAHHLGMNASCTEIWDEVFEYNRNKLIKRATSSNLIDPDNNEVIVNEEDIVIVEHKSKLFRLYRQSAMDMSCIKDNSLDLVCSSPPYYDTEDYSDDPEQLAGAHSKRKGYNKFLKDQEKVLQLCWNKLKDESFIVWCISDFRRQGKMYMYHADCIRSLENVGFTPWDIVIYNSGELATLFSTYNEEAGRTAKVHEYALVYKKIE